MPRRLSIFQNELNQGQDVQNQQINLALQQISSWGTRVKNEISSVFSDDNSASTTSTTFVTIPNWQNTIKTGNPLIRVDVSLCINCAGNVSYLALVVDGEIKRTVKMSGAGENIVSFCEQFSTYTGSHDVSIQWKTNTGTINKIQDGGSKVFVTNLI